MDFPGAMKKAAQSKGKQKLDPAAVHEFLNELFGDDIHAKRVLSLANGVIGAIEAAALSVHAIGHGLSEATGAESKHAIKQVDRLLSNGGVDVWDLFGLWVPFVVADRKEVVVAMDWTEFDKDEQATIAIHLITGHGRATPLLWKTVSKPAMAGMRNEHEDAVLLRLREVLPSSVKVTVLADRGFGDQKLYEALSAWKFDYVIRFRACVQVESETGERHAASEWVPSNGRVCLLRTPRVTTDRTPVGAVVCVKAAKMKEAWILATSYTELSGAQIVALYGKRFTIEENFRDTKDIRFGLGLAATRISRPERRDRLLLIGALAQALLTLLGAAGEALGLDRTLKANTSKRRTHSLFRQGCLWYRKIRMMPEPRLEMLMRAFGQSVRQHAVFTQVFGPI